MLCIVTLYSWVRLHSRYLLSVLTDRMPAFSAKLCHLPDNSDGLFLASAACLLTIHFNCLRHFHRVLEPSIGQILNMTVFTWISCCGWVPLLEWLLLKYHSFSFCPLMLPMKTYAWYYVTSREWSKIRSSLCSRHSQYSQKGTLCLKSNIESLVCTRLVAA